MPKCLEISDFVTNKVSMYLPRAPVHDRQLPVEREWTSYQRSYQEYPSVNLETITNSNLNCQYHWHSHGAHTPSHWHIVMGAHPPILLGPVVRSVQNHWEVGRVGGSLRMQWKKFEALKIDKIVLLSGLSFREHPKISVCPLYFRIMVIPLTTPKPVQHNSPHDNCKDNKRYECI